jgi:hypothetical protein
MEFGEIYIAFVAWKGGGKARPVLVVKAVVPIIFVYKITSQYAGKSPALQAKYAPIADWRLSGLDKPSYIDTTRIIALRPSSFFSPAPIGKLTKADEDALIAYLKTRDK